MAGMHTDRSGKQVVGKKRKTRGNATFLRDKSRKAERI